MAHLQTYRWNYAFTGQGSQSAASSLKLYAEAVNHMAARGRLETEKTFNNKN